MTNPFLLVMPGASLMRITEVTNGLRVECPGCGAVTVYRPRAGRVQHRPFIHALDDCPTLAAIDRALLTVPAPDGKPA